MRTLKENETLNINLVHLNKENKMTDRVQMIFVKPEFTGMEQAQKKDKARNRNMTALSLAGVGAGTALASTKKAQSLGIQAIFKTGEMIGHAQNVGNKLISKTPKKLNAVIGKAADSAAGLAIKSKAAIVNKAQQINKAVPGPVKIAAAVATGLLALAHAKDSGEIESRYEGYKGANDGANNMINGMQEMFKNIQEKAQDALGIEDKKEQKQCMCGQTPCAC